MALSIFPHSSAPTFRARSIRILWLRLRARWSRNRFLLREHCLARLYGVQPHRILFSSHTPQWQSAILDGFARTPHRISFGDMSTADRSAHDIVVPLTVRDVLALGASAALDTPNPIPIPDAGCVTLCDDKLRLNQALIAHGFGAHIPEVLQQPMLPFMLKKRVAENSEHCHVVDSAAALARHADLLTSPDYFCQRLVSSTSEYATHVLFVRGRIAAEVTVEYVADREVFVKGSEPFITCGLRPCPCADLFRDLLEAIGFEGICCVNYKIENGRPYLLEINPRFGFSLGPFFFSFIRHLPRARG